MSSDIIRIAPRNHSAGPPRIVEILGGVAVPVLLLAAGAAASELIKSSVLRSVLPQQPLLVLSVALVFAHCAAGAIWWVRSRWSPHMKTTVMVIGVACLWLVLAQLLQTTRHSPVAALSWAVCIAFQVSLTGLAAAFLELSISYSIAAARTRFSLHYMFVWTTLLAIALGGAGITANKFGFQLADVADWEFFVQLQGVAVAVAAASASVYACFRLPRLRPYRGPGCAAIATASAILAPVILSAIFGNKLGASLVDLMWLFGAQSSFLLVTLATFQVGD